MHLLYYFPHSISAGLAMQNVETKCIINATFIEYRGRSFDAGGVNS